MKDKPGGSVDVCILESDSDHVGMWYGWQPADIVAEPRGDIKLYTYIQLTSDQAEQAKAEIERHPQRPYQIFQSLFSSALLPAVRTENLRDAFEQEGLRELQDLSKRFPNTDLRHINSILGISLAEEGEVLEPAIAFKRLLDRKEDLALIALSATRLSRFSPQQSLLLGDIRGVSELAVENVKPCIKLLQVV